MFDVFSVGCLAETAENSHRAVAQEVIATLASSLRNVRPFLSLVPQVWAEDFLGPGGGEHEPG